MTCLITNWYGRNGNNILQLTKALYYCYKFNMSEVKFPSHPLLKSCSITLSKSQSDTIVKGMFYNQDNMIELDVDKMRELSLNYILPILNIKPVKSELTIGHIRGGDIFTKNPHPEYVQPPLSYYETLRPHLIVHEDNRNPCVQALKKRGYTLQSKDLKEDLGALLGASNVVCSHSTFSLMAFFLNENLKYIHVPGELVTHMRKSVNLELDSKKIKKHIFHNYIQEGEWGNSQEQLSMMLSYVV